MFATNLYISKRKQIPYTLENDRVEVKTEDREENNCK